MGSSGTGVGGSFKKKANISGRTLVAGALAPFTAGTSLVAEQALAQKERSGRKSAERKAATQARLKQEAETAQKLQEQQEAAEIAQESVRKQKAKARRRTIFAGQPLEQNIFRQTLGG
jgi:hypothetical protein